MFGIPLHPLIVHFPIVLVILLPISAIVALWAIRRGTTPRRAWAVPLAFAATLSISSFVATRTGENEEDRVERVVAERALHDHEEAGERFLMLSGVLLVVATIGLVPGTLGQAARLLSTAGAVALIAAGIQVGHSGGSLVYKHGAASAYVSDPSASPRRTADAEREER